MKLINYNYGYYQQFNCSIHGKIVMTLKEWRDALKFLRRKKWSISSPWIARVLSEDISKHVPNKNSFLVNIRVPATEALVKRYNLAGYKRANYMLQIIP